MWLGWVLHVQGEDSWPVLVYVPLVCSGVGGSSSYVLLSLVK